jgi:hypothetical protein
MHLERRRAVVPRRAAAAGCAVALALLPETGARADQQVDLTLNYTCVFPVIGNETVSIAITATAPTTVVVGRPLASLGVTASVTVPAVLTIALENLFGVSTITGTARGEAYIQASQGTIAESVPFTIPQFTLPPDATFTAAATGTVPPITFTAPGRAVATVGDISLQLIPKDASGNLTGLGTIDLPCTLDSGQNDVAANMTVISAAASSAPATGSHTQPATHAGPTSTSPSPIRTTTGGTDPTDPATTAAQSSAADSADPVDSSGSFVPVSSTAAGPGRGANRPLLLGVGLLALVGLGAAAFAYRARRHGH